MCVFDMNFYEFTSCEQDYCCCTQVEDLCASVENTLYEIYDLHQPLISDKVQQLSATLDRIAVLENEIEAFTQSLACFFKDSVVQGSP